MNPLGLSAWHCARAVLEWRNARRRSRKRAEKQDQPAAAPDDSNARVVTVPLPSGFEMVARIPREVRLADLRRLAYALLPYATD